MFDLKPKTLYNQYRNGLSDYKIDIENGKWGNKKVEIIDFETGEILKPKTVYRYKRLGRKQLSLSNDRAKYI